MIRLFAGIPVPDRIGQALARIKQPLPGAKWVEPENYHITLRFAGDIDNAIAHEFADFLSRIDVDAFSLGITGLGAFGGNDPRVLWAGIEPSEGLMALQRATEMAARSAGLKPERQQFKPHVTLARLRHSRPDAVSKLLQHHGALESPAFLVDRFVLYSSKPRTGGGPYVVERYFALAGSVNMDLGASDDLKYGLVRTEVDHRGRVRGLTIARSPDDSGRFLGVEGVFNSGYGPNRTAGRGTLNAGFHSEL